MWPYPIWYWVVNGRNAIPWLHLQQIVYSLHIKLPQWLILKYRSHTAAAYRNKLQGIWEFQECVPANNPLFKNSSLVVCCHSAGEIFQVCYNIICSGIVGLHWSNVITQSSFQSKINKLINWTEISVLISNDTVNSLFKLNLTRYLWNASNIALDFF